MVRALAVSDEVASWAQIAASVGDGAVDLVVAAGDLPFDYLGEIAGRLDLPGVMVPGNHDPDITGFTHRRGMSMRDGMPVDWPGPSGFDDADGRIVDVAGLRIAGLGGCVRYRPGPNQWTQREQARRARRLVRAARRATRRDGIGVDVLLTHAPPRHCGDGDDAPHHGFECLHDVVEALTPRLLLHGHIHPYGQHLPDRFLGATRVVNIVGRRVMEL